jgi:glutathione synthase
VNPAEVIALQGDKLGPPALARALPPTVVTSSWECLERFGRAEGRAVLKPLGGAQSRGVQLLDWSSPEGAARARRAAEALSEGFARPVLLQRFLPEIHAGEQRLWFLDGALLAHARKRPAEGTFVVDMDRGAACEARALAPAEERLARAVGEALRAQRVRLAAVDVIGDWVTDWNLTSPGMIPTLEEVLGRNLARPIVEALAGRDRRAVRPAIPARKLAG